MALAATSASEGCPQCATTSAAAALSLSDGSGPVRSAASGEAGEEGSVEEADREEKGKKDGDGAGGCGGCGPRKSCKELWYDIRMKLWGIVESKYFNRGIMIAILINTISMGIEHHEQVHV